MTPVRLSAQRVRGLDAEQLAVAVPAHVEDDFGGGQGDPVNPPKVRLQFYLAESLQPPESAHFPCAVLVKNSWDDFGFKTTFNLAVFTSRTGRYRFQDRVKVMKQGSSVTPLPRRFRVLGPAFCSLGESIDFYNQVKGLEAPLGRALLSGLNDVAFRPELVPKFQDDPAWSLSLLRFSEAEKALREARNWFETSREPTDEEKHFRFRFLTTVPGAASPHNVEFDFLRDETDLHRISALIGRNGTGKTQFLANLAHGLSGITQGNWKFEPERPSFSKVIALSYGVLDDFERPRLSDTFSYVYCGIRTPGNALASTSRIADRLRRSVRAIQRLERGEQWTQVIKALFDGRLYPLDYPPEPDDIEGITPGLSSGQRIILLILSEVVANIEPDSVLLFDEPELHLHPDAISTLARALRIILDAFESYAVLATHSPILLQEIPSKHVSVFERIDDRPVVRPLVTESFGESLSLITDEVFGRAVEAGTNFQLHLERLAEEHSVEEIQELFGGRLGFNATSYLAALAALEAQAEE